MFANTDIIKEKQLFIKMHLLAKMTHFSLRVEMIRLTKMRLLINVKKLPSENVQKPASSGFFITAC